MHKKTFISSVMFILCLNLAISTSNINSGVCRTLRLLLAAGLVTGGASFTAGGLFAAAGGHVFGDNVLGRTMQASGFLICIGGFSTALFGYYVVWPNQILK